MQSENWQPGIFLQYLSFIIFDPFIDLFITLCIVVNTLFMALDHHDMDPGMNDTLKNGNYVKPFLEVINFVPRQHLFEYFDAVSSTAWAAYLNDRLSFVVSSEPFGYEATISPRRPRINWTYYVLDWH